MAEHKAFAKQYGSPSTAKIAENTKIFSYECGRIDTNHPPDPVSKTPATNLTVSAYAKAVLDRKGAKGTDFSQKPTKLTKVRTAHARFVIFVAFCKMF